MKSVMPEGETVYNETESLSGQVLSNTSSAGCDRIRQEMQILQNEMSSLQASIHQTETALEESVQGLEEFDIEHTHFVEWLTSTEEKVKASSQQQESMSPVEVEAKYEVRKGHHLSGLWHRQK